MPLTYLDQNALIKMGFRAQRTEVREKLDPAIKSGALTIVVSPWHLIETANTSNLENALKLAAFIDSLNPAWLLDRHDIRKLEVAEDLFRFAKMGCSSVPRVTSRSAVFAALNGQHDAAKFDIPAVKFVQQWMEHPEQLEVLEKTYKDNEAALLGLRKLMKAGKLTDAIMMATNRKLLEVSMPEATPAGLAFGRELSTEYLDQANIGSIPMLSLEHAISLNEWNVQGQAGADRNTLIDKFHLISALHYVDEIVSDDGFFHEMYPVVQKTGHVRANLLRNEEFLKRF